MFLSFLENKNLYVTDQNCISCHAYGLLKGRNSCQCYIPSDWNSAGHSEHSKIVIELMNKNHSENHSGVNHTSTCPRTYWLSDHHMFPIVVGYQLFRLGPGYSWNHKSLSCSFRGKVEMHSLYLLLHNQSKSLDASLFSHEYKDVPLSQTVFTLHEPWRH